MISITGSRLSVVAPLFAGWEESLIWSCLQGCMGTAWADTGENPSSARILIGDFCFLAGSPSEELLQDLSPCLLLIPQSPSWEKLIERVYSGEIRRFSRYAIQKEGDIFHRESLRENVRLLSPEYRIAPIQEPLYRQILQESWCRDFCSQFAGWEDFQAHGIGFVALKGDEIVGGASSYTYYLGGIEIEVDTKAEHRRRGIALSCSSQLILACLEQGLYPSWDAASLDSVSLAEKLGYHLDHPYTAYQRIQKEL